MAKILGFSGLKGFGYYKVSSSFELTANHEESYFQEEILEKRTWMGNPIKQLFESAGKSAFDSGVISAKEEDFIFEGANITSLKCFVAPYQLMNLTIGKHSKSIDTGEIKPKLSRPNKLKINDGIAVAVGMVLSIMATKGSVEQENRAPYLMLIRRQNANIRKDQLDAPVVEGLNYGDFYEENGKFMADLTRIAKRALEEECGLNCDMLESRGLLHMPKNYYLGYDEEYHQWNFFGTVVVDCSIEELVREGCYFTKDKFESKGIVCLPADPNTLFYYLSYRDIPIINKNGHTHHESTQMWNTGWASVLFALRDFKDNKKWINEKINKIEKLVETHFPFAKSGLNSIEKNVDFLKLKDCLDESFLFSRNVCFLLKNVPWLRNIWLRVRKLFNLLATCITAQERMINILCVILAVKLLWATVQSESDPIKFGILVTKLSTAITLITCCYVVISFRGKYVNRRDLIRISTYWEKNAADNLSIPETVVFRNVSLIDGNVSEKERKVFFSFENDPTANVGYIDVKRKCNVFSEEINKQTRCWTLKKTSTPKEIVENFSWKFVGNGRCTNSVRFVIPCIIDERSIAFKREHDRLKHLIDFKIDYREFSGKNDSMIRRMIINKAQDCSSDYLDKIDSQISFRFLLQFNEEMVIVGFIEKCKSDGNSIIYQLSHSLSNTSFCERMLDDITRVACEYAVTEYVGYDMSNR